jgi:hypothetical protein
VAEDCKVIQDGKECEISQPIRDMSHMIIQMLPPGYGFTLAAYPFGMHHHPDVHFHYQIGIPSVSSELPTQQASERYGNQDAIIVLGRILKLLQQQEIM